MDRQDISLFDKVGEVSDRHFGAYGLKKNNTTVIYRKKSR